MSITFPFWQCWFAAERARLGVKISHWRKPINRYIAPPSLTLRNSMRRKSDTFAVKIFLANPRNFTYLPSLMVVVSFSTEISFVPTCFLTFPISWKQNNENPSENEKRPLWSSVPLSRLQEQSTNMFSNVNIALGQAVQQTMQQTIKLFSQICEQPLTSKGLLLLQQLGSA